MEVLAWRENALVLLDQTQLPFRVEHVVCRTPEEVARALAEMRIRGAPAIGVAAAYGMALAAFTYSGAGDLGEHLEAAATTLKGARPTAVNLERAVDAQLSFYRRELAGRPLAEVRERLLERAQELARREKERDARIAAWGEALVPDGARVLTYCNTGALATGGTGTALGVIRRAHKAGKRIHVYVPETRPVLQGARLTAWELQNLGIPFTLVTDNTCGYLFAAGKVDLVLVGADRIAANGDFANKIGTSVLAVLARHYRRPFYVAAPVSSFDPTLATGSEIPIELRSPEEVRFLSGTPVTLPECPVLNPAFDVTPGELVTSFITDRGVVRPPFTPEFCREEE